MKDKQGNELIVTPGTYKKAAKDVSDEIGSMAKTALKKNIRKLAEEKKSGKKKFGK